MQFASRLPLYKEKLRILAKLLKNFLSSELACTNIFSTILILMHKGERLHDIIIYNHMKHNKHPLHICTDSYAEVTQSCHR